MNPFSHISKTYCINCQKDDVVDLIDIHNRRLNYPAMLKDNNIIMIEESINRTEFVKMRCNSCGQLYMIDWSKGLPEPVFSPYLSDMFMKY